MATIKGDTIGVLEWDTGKGCMEGAIVRQDNKYKLVVQIVGKTITHTSIRSYSTLDDLFEKEFGKFKHNHKPKWAREELLARYVAEELDQS